MSESTHWLLPEGITETLPPQAEALERLRRRLLDLYRSWGYRLVFPPFVEYLESLLTGTGGDLDIQTFKLTDQITGRTLGIRADITPQVARIDAHQLRSDYPTRLCYLGTVLHTRGSGLGASRSPLQIGAELYGHAGVEADLEILCLMLDTLQQAAISDIYLDLGHVGIFRGLIRQAGLDREQEAALFDALQRKAVPELQVLVEGFQLKQSIAGMLIALADLSGDQALARARQQLAAASPEVIQALDELEQVAERLAQCRPQLPVHYDLAELRGYHYHTGVVFAAFVPGQGQEVVRGGRYDDIGRLFGTARPACGFSADLSLLLQLGDSRGDAPHRARILAPAADDEQLQQTVARLRAEGRQVIMALPGQRGGAAEMGCVEVLARRGDSWIIEPA